MKYETELRAMTDEELEAEWVREHDALLATLDKARAESSALGKWASNRDHPERVSIALKWRAIRQEAGRRIDPKTAEVISAFDNTEDPYRDCHLLGIYHDFQDGGSRYRFARSPGSDILVLFDDLPDATVRALAGRA